MANSRITGITIEIGGDTTKLQDSLKKLDKQLSSTKAELKDVDKLLKLDPGNTELLRQKQERLGTAIKDTKTRLEELQKAQDQVDEGTKEWDAIQREIVATEQDLKGLQKSMDDFGSVSAQKLKVVGENLQTVGGKITKVGEALTPVSAAAGALVGSLLKLGSDAGKTADELNTLAKQTGISTDELQKMQYAAELVDVSVDDITSAIKKLKQNMDPANETLKKLGIEVTNADGSMRSANEVFYDVIQALSGIKNETERDQVAMKLFGKSADNLAGIIDDGGQAFKKYGNEAERLGYILSGDTLDALNETQDTVDKLKNDLKATALQLGATVLQKLAPSIEKLSGFVATLTEKIRNLTPAQVEMILKIGTMVAALAPLLTIGGKLISGIGTLLTMAPLLATAFGAMAPYILPITVAIAGLVAAGVLLYKNWDTITAKANQLKQALVNTWNTIATGISNAFNRVVQTITNTFNNIRTFVQNAIQSIKNLFNFNWTLPHIKLPHFYWKWLNVGGIISLPEISIQWYKKAYDNPYLFTSPTVMNTSQGLKGFGDGAGGEVVLGMDKLKELVGAAGDVIINVYASQGMDINELASEIEQRFINIQRQKEAAGLA